VTATLRLEIFPADLERTIGFYEGLGFELAARSDGPPPYASLRLGHVRIGACEAERVDPARRAVPAGTEIVIEVDDVRELRHAAVAAGVTLNEDLRQQRWGLLDVRVSDPDGYYLRFTSRR
jgi:lactoylglutathione lyase